MIKSVVLSTSRNSPTDSLSYALPANVALLLVRDGTARLLDFDGYFHAISATGAKMLQETLERGSEAAARRIAEQYDVDAHQIRADLDAFLADLERRQLVCRFRGRQRSASTILVSLFLASTLRCAHLGANSLKAKALHLLTLAYFSFRFFGWTRTVASWQRFYGEVSTPRSLQESEEIARAIDSAVRTTAAKHVLNVGCKERSIVCWALMRSTDLPVRLVLGVDLFPLASHCWCELGPLVLSDYEDRCERFTPVLKYG
jgi:hypothetical protein